MNLFGLTKCVVRSGIGFAALVLMTGMAQAAGYWKQKGLQEFPNLGEDMFNLPGGYWKARREYEKGACNVRFTFTGARGEVRITEIAWTPPPEVLIPDQVIPLAARMQVLTSQPEGTAEGGVSCYPGATPMRGGITDFFSGLDQPNSFNKGSTGFIRELVNTRHTAQAINQERKFYLTHCITGMQIGINVATPYVWVEGEPPPPPVAARLPPRVVVSEGKIPAFVPAKVGEDPAADPSPPAPDFNDPLSNLVNSPDPPETPAPPPPAAPAPRTSDP